MIIFAALLSLTFSIGLPRVQAAVINCNATDLSSKDAAQCGACGASNIDCGTTDPQKAATDSANTTIRNVVNIMSIIGAIIAVIMIILSGIRYVSSGGNEQAVAGAKRSLIYAVLGLVIVALAQVIARFALNKTVT